MGKGISADSKKCVLYCTVFIGVLTDTTFFALLTAGGPRRSFSPKRPDLSSTHHHFSCCQRIALLEFVHNETVPRK
jgi:hypothetical protein